MNPSSPSNVDHPAGPTFKVTSRALSADLSTARSDESVRELGTPDGAGLVALMEKLAVLDASEVAEADPQLVGQQLQHHRISGVLTVLEQGVAHQERRPFTQLRVGVVRT